MMGRVCAGIATSILFSAFESWAICQHDNVCEFNFLVIWRRLSCHMVEFGYLSY